MRPVDRPDEPRLRAVLPTALGAMLLSCIAPETPAHVEASSAAQAISLVASSYRGEPIDPLRLPRRPRLALRSGARLDPAADQIWLLEGSPNEALWADLERSPLLAEHRARIVPCAIAEQPDGLELVPHAPLDRGAQLSFVLAQWAVDLDGERLGLEAPLVLELQTLDDPEAGARLTGSWPADGATSVGTNLPAAIAAFDGELHGADAGIWLEGPDGHAVEVELSHASCAELAPELAAHDCVALAPTALLPPLAEHALVVGRGAIDALGAPVGPARVRFRTGSGPDPDAPLLLPQTCALDEIALSQLCALVDDQTLEIRVRADEAFVATLTLEDSRTRPATLAAPSAEGTLRIEGLEPGMRYTLELELRDGTGNRTTRDLELSTPSDLPTLSITEVRADPEGPEPAQEAVELLNFGSQPIALTGMTLTDSADDPGEPFETSAVLDPGARALLVPDAFDPLEASDAALPPGTQLVRIGRSLGTSGLANRGEPVFLRDALGRRVSAAPATPRPLPGICSARIVEDPRTGAAGSFGLDPDGGCTLGH